MFVQYSFVQHRPAPIAGTRRAMVLTPPIVMSAGIAAMIVTSLGYVLS